MSATKVLTRLAGVVATLLVSSMVLAPEANADNSRFYFYADEQKISPDAKAWPLPKFGAQLGFAVKVNYKLYFEDTSPIGELEIIDGGKVLQKDTCAHYVTNDDGQEGTDRLVRFYCANVNLNGTMTTSPVIKFTYTSTIEKLIFTLPIDSKNTSPIYSYMAKASLSLNGVLSVVLELITSAKGEPPVGSKANNEICIGDSCVKVPTESKPILRDGNLVLQGKLDLKLTKNQLEKIKDTGKISYKSTYNGVMIIDSENNSTILASVEIEKPPPPITKLVSTIRVPISTTLGTIFSADVKIIGKGTANCSIYLAPSRSRGIYSGNGVNTAVYRISAGTSKAIPLVMGEKFQGTWGAILNCTDSSNGAYLKINVATVIQR